MTYSFTTPSTSTPSWVDCFATSDGRIVVVGGTTQFLVYNIGSASWEAVPTSSIKYGPSVSADMFLNPVYLQARILADGYTALVVCTLKWTSQPQPYYLNTRNWMVTLAIGTAGTTPPASSSSSSGWGVVPGSETSPLPPPGFRHYTLAILGQDPSKDEEHYGNGRAYILGGYSSTTTGFVKDWETITSFPVQQAPSNVMIMFGNMAQLSKPTRGSVAYPVSRSSLGILLGNGGSTGSQQQQVAVYNSDQNIVQLLQGIDGGPKNTIFRGATVIGRGSQIFFHGGITSLEFNNAASSTPPLELLDQSVGVWDGATQKWSDTASIYVPPKSKGLMIGLIVGGVVLLLLVGAGVWYIQRRKKQRRLEEEERRAKGLVLKNEDRLQKEHRISGPGTVRDGDSNVGTGTPYQTHLGYSSPAQESHRTAAAELVEENMAHYGAASYGTEKVPVRSPQFHPTNDPNAALANDTNDALHSGNISIAPAQYQPVVTMEGYPVYGREDHSQGSGSAISSPAQSQLQYTPGYGSAAASPAQSHLQYAPGYGSATASPAQSHQPQIQFPVFNRSSMGIMSQYQLQPMSPQPSDNSPTGTHVQLLANTSSDSPAISVSRPYSSSSTLSFTAPPGVGGGGGNVNDYFHRPTHLNSYVAPPPMTSPNLDDEAVNVPGHTRR
ncbi:hypothetical protein BGW38_005693 [Lunasporangiospora selenospora]|uniref:Uncharacterized protein n=1 Tax=Lunasporangiospora selenospora TaxID=979761 RepID=A0A9P6FNI0_9FUNG|nr:hypothetical protein BGW38_005693 [Lunasporangiospora selenospora]